MNPFETLAIKLLFTVQDAPSDFISGLIQALDDDLANREPDAQKNIDMLMEKVAQLRVPVEMIDSARILCQLSTMWKANGLVQKQAGLVEKISQISQCDPKAPFGTRIALERIASLTKDLKASAT